MTILVCTLLVGVAVGAWNTWQRLGRSARARAWFHDARPGVRRNVLVLWPLFATACVAAATAGLARHDAVVAVAATVLGAALLGFLAWAVLPLPVPRFVEPRWCRGEASRKGRRGG